MVSISNAIGQGEWAHEIGKLLVAFGNIESMTRMVVRSLCTEVVARHTVNMPLGDRLRFVSDLVGELDGDRAQIEAYQQAVKEAIRLSKIRNMVAHNPLCLVFFDGDDGEHTMQQAIAREGRNDHLTLPLLKNAANDARACQDAMSAAYFSLVPPARRSE